MTYDEMCAAVRENDRKGARTRAHKKAVSVSEPKFEWRGDKGRFEYGYSGGDGEILPERDIIRGNSGSWIVLGKVLQDGQYGFCCYAIGIKSPRGSMVGRSPTIERAKKRVQSQVSKWVGSLIDAWKRS